MMPPMTNAVAVGERVTRQFGGFFTAKLINEHGAAGSHQRGLRDVFLHGVGVVCADMARPPRT